MSACACSRNDLTEIALDSSIYYGMFYVRDAIMKQTSGRQTFYSDTEKLWKTGVFAGASYGWNMLPESIYAPFEYAGNMIQIGPFCGECMARNLYIVFIQFLVSWFRDGMAPVGTELMLALDEFIRLLGVDLTSSWVRPALMGGVKGLSTYNSQRMPGTVETGIYTELGPM